MINLTIDGIKVQVEEGTPLHKAAQAAGVDIPVMCYHDGMEHFTSCMVCLVKDAANGRLLPSCSVKAVEGMSIITGDDEVRAARKASLELLLGEHIGDCEAPCRITCPAGMDIPLMNRLLAAGDFKGAYEVVKQDIAMPAMLGRICPAPCEGACRRKQVDEAVSICLLKRFSADYHTDEEVFIPGNLKEQSIAIIGAGPAGLAAAWYCRMRGFRVKLFEKESKAGGAVRTGVPEEQLPGEVLDHEIENILASGIEAHFSSPVNKELFDELNKKHDAIIIACALPQETAHSWGLEHNGTGLPAEKGSYRLGETHIFAIGSAVRPVKMAVRSQGQGKEVAFSIEQLLCGKEVKGEPQRFNSRFGKLLSEELPEYMKEADDSERKVPVSGSIGGFSPEEVIAEAKRCMRCDCREKENCLLREYADVYKADQKHFPGSGRIRISKVMPHGEVIYEASKCIKCGICVRLSAKEKEKYGFTFIGRGFDVHISVPFDKKLGEAFTATASAVVAACPTGALAIKNKMK